MEFCKSLKKKGGLAYQEVYRGVAELDAGGLRLRQSTEAPCFEGLFCVHAAHLREVGVPWSFSSGPKFLFVVPFVSPGRLRKAEPGAGPGLQGRVP